MKRFIPLLIFLGIGWFFLQGLGHDPHKLPSILLGKSIPTFSLPAVKAKNKTFSNADLLGHVSLMNVWATWCMACRYEHADLMKIAKQAQVHLYGLNYKDNKVRAKNWLQQFGDPYEKSGFDADGRVAIDWGVYGTPETFVIDKQGVIRKRYVGPITAEAWQEEFLPLIRKLQA